jgi:hypothetical protein
VKYSPKKVIESMGLSTINLGKSESQVSMGEEENWSRKRG